MILNNAPQAEAVLSNVGEIGEFRIRNSAKAFNILSSGLYANKIKAIVRELSCNAVDSHVAAGTDKPFDIHLPTALAPHFAIRDYGTGLSHDQVTNIYTTYFESTKTGSNDFIGALGLGSKSPFSYTDNFTVTAIKDGHKGIYTAFINDQGVPSIALMAEEDTDEPSGVEIKFSVNDRNDFFKFEQEAKKVFRWFKQQPNFNTKIQIEELTYDTKNIIPGVHSLAENHTRCVAVMGNIAYPIEVPNVETNLPDVRALLNCGLVMEFGIGELDFQASREGLSYIPQTIDSIRKKLTEVNGALTDVLAKEADAITCEWARSQFLYKKMNIPLWNSAVKKYATDTGFALIDTSSRYSSSYSLRLTFDDIAKFNIQLSGFTSHRGDRCGKITPGRENTGKKNADGTTFYELCHHIRIEDNAFFIQNDTKVGGTERAKAHFRKNVVGSKNHWGRNVFVMEKIDRTKDMDVKGFFAMLHNPPLEQRMLVSSLDERERNSSGGMGRNITLLKLEERGGSRYRSASSEMVWRDGGSLKNLDDTKTYYYVPLSGFAPQWKNNVLMHHTVHELCTMLKNTKLPDFSHAVYGVRKTDLPTIQKKKNWVLVEDHINTVLKSMAGKIHMARIMDKLDSHAVFNYNITEMVKNLGDKSPAKAFLNDFAGLPKINNLWSFQTLLKTFGITSTVDVDAMAVVYRQKLKDFDKDYPLFTKFGSYVTESDLCEYINLVDKVKGI